MSDTLEQSMMQLSNSLNTANAVISSHKEDKYTKRYNQWYYENITKPYAEWQLENITKPFYGYQQDKQIEMIPRSLKANMDALKANGINPLMLNGGLELPASAGGTEDSLYSSPAAPDIGSIMSGYGAMRSGDAASNLMLSQMAKNYADTEKVKSETKAQNSFNEFARELYQGNAKTAQGNALNVVADTSWKKADIKRIYSSANELDEHAKTYQTSIEEMREHITLMQSQGKLNNEMAKEIPSRIALNIAESLYSQFKLKIGTAEIRELEARADLALRQGSTYAPYEYIEALLRDGNRDIQNGILGEYKANFYRGEDAEWHYGIDTGNLDIVSGANKSSSTLYRNISTTKAILDILGISFTDASSSIYKNLPSLNPKTNTRKFMDDTRGELFKNGKQLLDIVK